MLAASAAAVEVAGALCPAEMAAAGAKAEGPTEARVMGGYGVACQVSTAVRAAKREALGGRGARAVWAMETVEEALVAAGTLAGGT